jgi:outer membrane biosynthesis protein TonB
MAPRAKKTAAPEPDVEVADYSGYRDKPATDLQERMADWVLEQVDPIAHDENGDEVELDVDSFKEGIRLGVALRMQFQASPENQEVLAANRAAREAGEEEPKPAKRKPAKAKAAPEPEPEELDEEDAEEPEEEPTPAPKAKRTASARAKATGSTPAKPVRRTRGKTAAKVPAEVGADAPF